MDVITNNIEYCVTREISAIKLNEKLYCFKEVQKIKDKVILEKEGFTKNINVKDEQDIKCEKGICLMKNEVLDINRNEVGGFYSIDSNKQKEFIESKPFSYILNHPNWTKDYLILNYYFYSGDLRTLDGDYYSKKLSFNYFECLTNEYYDLEALFKYLKTKENDRLKLTSDGVISIPYYNCHHGINKQICFEYIPTQEEYNHYKKDLKLIDDDIKYKILEKLGVLKFKSEEDFYED